MILLLNLDSFSPAFDCSAFSSVKWAIISCIKFYNKLKKYFANSQGKAGNLYCRHIFFNIFKTHAQHPFCRKEISGEWLTSVNCNIIFIISRGVACLIICAAARQVLSLAQLKIISICVLSKQWVTSDTIVSYISSLASYYLIVLFWCALQGHHGNECWSAATNGPNVAQLPAKQPTQSGTSCASKAKQETAAAGIEFGLPVTISLNGHWNFIVCDLWFCSGAKECQHQKACRALVQHCAPGPTGSICECSTLLKSSTANRGESIWRVNGHLLQSSSLSKRQ